MKYYKFTLNGELICVKSISNFEDYIETINEMDENVTGEEIDKSEFDFLFSSLPFQNGVEVAPEREHSMFDRKLAIAALFVRFTGKVPSVQKLDSYYKWMTGEHNCKEEQEKT